MHTFKKLFFTLIAPIAVGLGLVLSNGVEPAYAQNNNSFIKNYQTQISKGGNLNIAGANNSTADPSDEPLMTVIKNAINYALGLLGLISLIWLIRGGYQMVTSAGDDDKYSNGIKILKNAAIGIAFIAVSWMVVSFIFYVVGEVAQV